MMGKALVLALILAAPALAGCASRTQGEPARPNNAANVPFSDETSAPPVTVTPKPTSARWHFHDYWHGTPVITLLNTTVTLNFTVDESGARVLSTLVSLPSGVIVPAETGMLTINVTWPEAVPVPGGAVNLTYKPADSNLFYGAGNLSSGRATYVMTTASMCDVPHRQESLWKFNLTAVPNGTPPLLPARDVLVNITATIGRPLFIDPPHLDWWLGNPVIPLVTNAKGEVAATFVTKGANLTLPTDPQTATPSNTPADVRVSMDDGRIVPEGANSLVVVLNWTTQMPNAKLGVRYKESNQPSEGALKIMKDGAASRTFVLGLRPPQTDTTYSNRTTWEFHVRPDPSGVDSGAFSGSFTLNAWASTLTPDEALKALGLL